MSIKEIYEKLCRIETITNKIEFNSEVIIIRFNDYLKITACDDVIDLNDGLTHWHPNSLEELEQDLINIALGKVIFVEFRKWFFRFVLNQLYPNIKILKLEKYEKRKHKYLNKKKVRIYTGKKIIQYEK
ncbi:MAG: hypothetical protein K0Q49_1269 [Haloplasmataceae bacterium]|jgi:hypothetical protein|nr:hypothetical protein [Haloplasmataceae bacterium]